MDVRRHFPRRNSQCSHLNACVTRRLRMRLPHDIAAQHHVDTVLCVYRGLIASISVTGLVDCCLLACATSVIPKQIDCKKHKNPSSHNSPDNYS